MLLGLGLLGLHDIGAFGRRWPALDVLWGSACGLAVDWHKAVWWFVPLLLLFNRPLSVAIGLAGSSATGNQRLLIGWFGIRGIGSLYYLMYATNHGLPATLADQLTSITLSVVVASIVLHGISVTPLMAMYERTMTSRRRQRGGPAQPPRWAGSMPRAFLLHQGRIPADSAPSPAV